MLKKLSLIGSLAILFFSEVGMVSAQRMDIWYRTPNNYGIDDGPVNIFDSAWWTTKQIIIIVLILLLAALIFLLFYLAYKKSKRQRLQLIETIKQNPQLSYEEISNQAREAGIGLKQIELAWNDANGISNKYIKIRKLKKISLIVLVLLIITHPLYLRYLCPFYGHDVSEVNKCFGSYWCSPTPYEKFFYEDYPSSCKKTEWGNFISRYKQVKDWKANKKLCESSGGWWSGLDCSSSHDGENQGRDSVTCDGGTCLKERDICEERGGTWGQYSIEQLRFVEKEECLKLEMPSFYRQTCHLYTENKSLNYSCYYPGTTFDDYLEKNNLK